MRWPYTTTPVSYYFKEQTLLAEMGGPARLLETGRVTADTCVDCAYAPCRHGHLAADQRACFAFFQSF